MTYIVGLVRRVIKSDPWSSGASHRSDGQSGNSPVSDCYNSCRFGGPAGRFGRQTYAPSLLLAERRRVLWHGRPAPEILDRS